MGSPRQKYPILQLKLGLRHSLRHSLELGLNQGLENDGLRNGLKLGIYASKIVQHSFSEEVPVFFLPDKA